jgi:tRNA threonylcarbamoyladenosine biosynthesis protein TsaB
MPVILSLETSTDVCSVALHDNIHLLAHEEIHEPQSHAARLAPLIDVMLRKVNVQVKQIEAVAVTRGPGSYTGLRIGTSTAKGLCYALGIPLISVGTLELLAFQATGSIPPASLLCPMIDARRMEVYCLVTDSKLEVIQPVSAHVIDETSFAELLEGNQVLFFGNGANKCRQVITHSNAAFLEGIYPQASALGLMADEKFRKKQFEDLVHFKPFYLKEFVAKKAAGH